MEQFTYFVRFSVWRSRWPFWASYKPGFTVLTVRFPVRDHEDTLKFRECLAKEIFGLDGSLVEPRHILLDNMTLLELSHTKAHDKFREAKKRAEKEKKHGPDYKWWRDAERTVPGP